ncbi:D-inositol 3-phosphate glycosyltransferase [Phoenix dactylifera]|uniref:D-inositol 3-phosphate glycosyltransferase n=1 Tax=Phoenix dactylifera TaxID=42345 RepID=A0A8B7BU82_PHODC|nr:D-inositol 3-phosphate glycosyltransferase [Phoenix dactylifera]
MAKDHPTFSSNFYQLCCFLFVFSALTPMSFVYWSRCFAPCKTESAIALPKQNQTFDLLAYPSAWNHLSFSPGPPPRLLKIALFVKRWPRRSLAGGLERHALTLHLALARRGHEIHVFTTSSSSAFPDYPDAKIKFHATPPSPAGYLNQALAWERFRVQNTTGKPFDMIHTESVGLLHGRARNLSHLAVSWHGIAYETIHSDIVQDLLRGPQEPRPSVFTERVAKVVDEVKFFRDYAHHVATSDHVGDVLKRIYMIPEERVHIIVNGVDEETYKPDAASGREFRRKVGVPDSATLVVGLAGRLVKDKGHPLMFEALKQVFMENASFQRNVYVLVAGDGPWGNRYRELGPNLLVLGPLEQKQLASFYNSLDVFINPTLRAQGLDHTFIEAMLSGVSVMGTRFASITGSLIVGPEIGYTFLPTVDSLKKSLHRILGDGRGVLAKKGEVARNRALQLFTAAKMAAAYERLFLCISKGAEVKDNNDYCKYPLPRDRWR